MAEPPRAISDELLGEALRLVAPRGAVRTLPVQGGSMVPTLRDGQRIAVEFVHEAPERGDILLFRQNRELVVHRYLGPAWFPDGSPGLRTRGDGRSELDPHLDPRRVVGRVVAVDAGDGWRDLRSGAAKLYALALAFHDLAWAVLAVAARKADGARGRPNGNRSWHERVERWDRWLLDSIHRRLFAVVHRRIPAGRDAFEGGDDA